MNMNSSRVIGTLLLALSVMPAAQAYDFKDASGYYSFTGQTRRSVYVTYASLQDNLNAYTDDVVIPSAVKYMDNEVPVRGVGDHALLNCQFVTSVRLPEGVGYIQEQAFSHCYSMEYIALPSTLELIGDYAFEFCYDMTSVILPASVSEFGYAVFTNCPALKEIKVEEGNPILEDADGILMTKGGGTLMQYPAGRDDVEFTVPAQVTSITDYAFSPAPNLISISLGPNVSTTNPLTFLDCTALESISVDAANAEMTDVEGVLYNKDITTLLQHPRGRAEAEYVLPPTVTTLGEMSMAYCRNLQSIVMPESMASLEIYSMAGTYPESITVEAHKPPTVAMGAFDDKIYTSATLYVHEADLAAYRADSAWKRFSDIRAIEGTGLDRVEADNDMAEVTFSNGRIRVSGVDVASLEVFDLTGRRLAAANASEAEVSARGFVMIKITETNGKVTTTKVLTTASEGI